MAIVMFYLSRAIVLFLTLSAMLLYFEISSKPHANTRFDDCILAAYNLLYNTYC